MEKIQIIGNIGKDAEVKNVNGVNAISFSVCTSQRWRDANDVQYEKTTWYECTIWRRSGESVEIAKYLTKGGKVYVEGTPSARGWKSSTGDIVAGMNVRVQRIELLGSKKDSDTTANDAGKQSNNSQNAAAPATTEITDFSGPDQDDLPF